MWFFFSDLVSGNGCRYPTVGASGARKFYFIFIFICISFFCGSNRPPRVHPVPNPQRTSSQAAETIVSVPFQQSNLMNGVYTAPGYLYFQRLSNKTFMIQSDIWVLSADFFLLPSFWIRATKQREDIHKVWGVFSFADLSSFLPAARIRSFVRWLSRKFEKFVIGRYKLYVTLLLK